MSSDNAPTPTKARLLIIDDLGSITNAQNYRAFRKAGYEIETAGSTARALSTLQGPLPDLILLEASLPQREGHQLRAFLRSLRKLPIILIGEGGLEEKLAGLVAGADDFLVVPYDFQELLVRIAVLLRRWQKIPTREQKIQVDLLVVEPIARKAFYDRQPLELGEREFEVLHYFVANPHRIISREELLNRIWHLPSHTASNMVEVCINGVRSKLKGHGKEVIQTFRRRGYCLGELRDQEASG